MPLPDQTPRLPKWPFLLGDAVLIGVIWLIVNSAGRPLPAEAVYAVAACGFCAALVCAIPFLTDYARQQDEALDERQRSLEALARTVSTAAEQIGIAVGGFNEIAELAQKNLRHAEQLPQKLHEKITEFQTRLAQATDEEKEELERELAALRGSESEKLESIADKITRAAADWVKTEAAAQKQLNATQALLAHFDENLARLDGKVGQFGEQLGQLREQPRIVPASAPARSAPMHSPDTEPASAEMEPADAELSPSAASTEAPISDPEPPGEPAAAANRASVASAQSEANGHGGPPAKAERKRAPKRAPEAKGIAAGSPAGEEVSSSRPRGRRPEPIEPLALEFSQSSPEESAPSVAVSADGATRLVVTAYIGIGNRLFIRGEGPGLSWEKGVPLQFVSIGKWRWETAEAAAPVKFKLYKNDESEFSGLAAPPLEPGRQMEVTVSP